MAGRAQIVNRIKGGFGVAAMRLVQGIEEKILCPL